MITKIMVAVKQVADPMVVVRVSRDGTGVESEQARPVLNPLDEIALEAAMRLREAGQAKEVIVASVGPAAWEGTLRTALAMGADRALRVDLVHPAWPLVVARILAALVQRESVELLFTGRQGVDLDQGQTAPMIAGLLGWGEATQVTWMMIDNDHVKIRRSVEEGMETISLSIPAVISVDLGLNTPRYASLPAIMRARGKPLEVIDPESLGISLDCQLEQLGVLVPTPRKPGVRVRDVEELINRLQTMGLLK